VGLRCRNQPLVLLTEHDFDSRDPAVERRSILLERVARERVLADVALPAPEPDAVVGDDERRGVALERVASVGDATLVDTVGSERVSGVCTPGPRISSRRDSRR
jgi:hypothetical protein